MAKARYSIRTSLLAASALAGSLALALGAPAVAQEKSYQLDLPSQPLSQALMAFGSSTDRQIVFSEGLVKGRTAPPVRGDYTAGQALAMLLAGSGLTAQANADGVILVQRADQDPQGGSAASGGATVEALIVTAQKREEDIQDVPIAISAFSQEDLTRSQVAGGPDLMTQVPNFTFTKTNFSGYSIQIRGIGTQAISATTDAAVAVAFNNTPFIRNRFFEQEFYDLERVEVLRGPQGTLYGRNATAGVVNIISAKPKFHYEAKASADVANYNSTRLEGMVNVPLVEDKVALRIAGAWTKRDGYDTNQITGNQIDGRDLWSSRVSLRVAPNDRLDVNLIWEHFEENDDRLRSGKQLCNTHEVTNISGTKPDGTPFSFDTTHLQTLPGPSLFALFAGVQGEFSQGCLPTSLYAPESFQTPNGISLPYYLPLGSIFLPTALKDPYVSRTQSPDLRVIESTIDPDYRAKSNVFELQASFDLTDRLTLNSETAYSTDFVFSLEDYNRFNTAPGAWVQPGELGARSLREGILQHGPNGGIFCDPQLGCSDRLMAVDLSEAKSRTFSQEFRISSDFDGSFNFSLGTNFLRYDTEDKYYVFINSLSLISAIAPYGGGLSSAATPLPPYVAGVSDNHECLNNGVVPGDPNFVFPVAQCAYLDPNPIGSLNDRGHNYFLSKNPYKLISYAVFGEAYYQITDHLKLTTGLRWTVDKKEAPRVPSWLLASLAMDYPVASVSEQEWREPTGRIALDWKPHLSFTDETLFYGSVARGYKAGGANPPGFVRVYYGGDTGADAAIQAANSATRPTTFDPEFVNAFELGTKNTLLDGRMTLNLAGFYYDYTGYQISEIVDRSAFNQNYDATVWGLELEAEWRPTENLRLGFKGGYEKTRLADGTQAIDLMDRTAGHEGWSVIKPFPTYASNCILPTWLFVGKNRNGTGPDQLIQVGNLAGGTAGGCELAYGQGVDPITRLPYVPNPTVYTGGNYLSWRPGYPGWDPSTAPNNGEGFYKDLSGNELPNAPNFTATVTADYTMPLPSDWLLTVHSDFYYQSESWWRIFNTPGYDRLKAYTNVNLAAIFANEDAGWRIMAYVKNVFDHDSITGAFLNSDDSGLTTNVFLNEPRLYGLRITKEWTGAGLLGGWFDGPHQGPYPFSLEVGGQVQRQDAPNAAYRPAFLDTFPTAIDPSGKQNDDLDWGDGREIKLTYAPKGAWMLSLGARFGETNGGRRAVLEGQEFHSCTLNAPCSIPVQQITVTDYGATDLYEREEHTVVDFLVGHDLGIGGLGRLADSKISAGLRYANFKSITDVSVYGAPDWYMPTHNAFKYGFLPGIHSTHHEYRGEMDMDREFKGAGPVASWAASMRLLGDEDRGRTDVEWSVSGGVLFGKQQASGRGSQKVGYYDAVFSNSAPQPPAYPPITTPIGFSRSRSVTVPTLGVSLGLSYKVDRFKVGAGYSWERYFNAIDGGVETHKSYDRTIDGPYFKLSVGFGG